jgi:uncharacterized protein YdeI (YjbR/CyaY-like superfamily)
MIETDKFERVEVTAAAQLREWLWANHAQVESIWLVTYKKHVSDKYVSVEQILDEVVCFGWIDGIRCKLDEDRTMQLLGPRRAGHWAKSYQERAARLEAAGRMQPAGLAAIAESKRLGLWDSMKDVDALVVPADMVAVFQGYPGSAERFAELAPSYRRNVLRWIKLAKTAPTRKRRIDQTVQATVQGERLPQM